MRKELYSRLIEITKEKIREMGFQIGRSKKVKGVGMVDVFAFKRGKRIYCKCIVPSSDLYNRLKAYEKFQGEVWLSILIPDHIKNVIVVRENELKGI